MTDEEKQSAVCEKRLEIRNELGLHARPAALFVQTANRFKCDVRVTKESEEVNGKSIMGIMTLAAGKGTVITVRATGDDAEAAVREIAQLVENNFGE